MKMQHPNVHQYLKERLNTPMRAWGVKSRMCPPYPQRDRKRRLNGAVCRIFISMPSTYRQNGVNVHTQDR